MPSTETLDLFLTQLEPGGQGHPAAGSPTAHFKVLDYLVLPPLLEPSQQQRCRRGVREAREKPSGTVIGADFHHDGQPMGKEKERGGKEKQKKYFGDAAKCGFPDWRSHGKLLHCLSQKSKAHSCSFFCYVLGTIY